MHKGEIKLERFEEIKKSPLFFLSKTIHESYDYRGIQTTTNWNSINNDIKASFIDSNWEDERLDFSLAIINKFEVLSDSNNKTQSVSVEFHAIQGDSMTDLVEIIQNTISRKSDPNDKFWMQELLWVLNWRDIDWNTFHNALQKFMPDVRQQFLGWVSAISKCLSYNKQLFLKSFLSYYNINYNITIYHLLKDARKSINVIDENIHYLSEEFNNLFDWVDSLCNVWENVELNLDEHNNIWLDFLQWMKTDKTFSDYSKLKHIIAMVDEPIRMNILKRYFHDIRIGNTTFDASIIEQFRHNDYTQYIQYRKCIQSPGSPLDLTIPILADNILTFIETNGRAFQTFDGILDFAMQNCDVTKPSISFHLEKFIPICNGGATYNKYNFCGFIDYAIVCSIDESMFTEENLRTTIESLIKQSRAQRKNICKSEEKPISEYDASRCANIKCEKLQKHDNIWCLSSEYATLVNLFLQNKLLQTHDFHQTVEFDSSQISTTIMAQSIRDFISKYRKLGNNKFVVTSEDTPETKLVFPYIKPESICIIPSKIVYIGNEFDVFGIWKQMKEQLVTEKRWVNEEHHLVEFKEKESAEIFKRVVSTLTSELGVSLTNGGYFEIPYDKKRLYELKNKYYYRPSIPNNQSQSKFLCKQHIKLFSPFCAPQLATTRNNIIDLPFFWCRGVECFHNNLSEHTLETCSNWEKYSLYHLIEIIGFPKLRKTEAGYEPDNCIREFIGLTNKAIKKFKQLKCRDCGHLLFTDRNYGYNRYNYFSCQNPSCKQYLKAIYLNYCHHCKKGLIDSRDSVQCPNGWYICPDCLACCNDQQFERQAQRYVLQQRPIPPRLQAMLGKGHNDKQEFFCYQCGTLLEEVRVNHDKKTICPNCQKDYTETGF